MSFTITAVERLEAQEGTIALALGGMRIPGRAAGFAARVETMCDPGASAGGAKKMIALGVSRLDGESEWIVDSLAIGGMPVYANGVGSRCTKLKALSDAEMVAALDAATDGTGHDCQESAVPYVSDGALGHGWECGICGRFLQAG